MKLMKVTIEAPCTCALSFGELVVCVLIRSAALSKRPATYHRTRIRKNHSTALVVSHDKEGTQEYWAGQRRSRSMRLKLKHQPYFYILLSLWFLPLAYNTQYNAHCTLYEHAAGYYLHKTQLTGAERDWGNVDRGGFRSLPLGFWGFFYREPETLLPEVHSDLFNI